MIIASKLASLAPQWGLQTASRQPVNGFYEASAKPGWPYLLSALSRKIGFRRLFLIWISAIHNKLLTSVIISILLQPGPFMFQSEQRRLPFLSLPIQARAWDG